MYCWKCGAENNSNAFKCVRCGEILQVVPRPVAPLPRVPDYLAHSIIATLLCCMIPGIVAIVHAAQVNGKLIAGDYAGAVQSSNLAKTWCWWSFGLGAGGWAIYAAVLIALAVSGSLK